MQIERVSLSTQIQEEIRERIVRGALEDGARLNEVELAKALGVSRTPVREALSQLVAERFVQQVPGRGFFVAELSREEIDQLYIVRQLLDPAALELAGIPEMATLDRLEELNERTAKARRARRVVELDDEWHLILLESCPNQILLDLIRQFMRMTFRYELAYMSDAANVEVVVREHAQILAALRGGDLARACAGLRQNMTSAQVPLVRHVEETSAPAERKESA